MIESRLHLARPRNLGPTGLVSTLSLAEVATVVSDWKAAGWLIPVRIEAGGEPSIATLRSLR